LLINLQALYLQCDGKQFIQCIQIDPKGDVVTDLGGRFKYAWEVNQFDLAELHLQRGLNCLKG
jgi:hypothetical protein